MKILVINPNSTVSMTRKIAKCATESVAEGTVVHTVNPPSTPTSIEGYYDAAMSESGVLDELRKGEVARYDGYVIACFDDVGIDSCRELATGPVMGICEAGLHAASVLAPRFTIMTTLPRVTAHIEDLVFRYGFNRKCVNVRAVDIPVLDLERCGNARHKIRDAIKQSIKEDHAEAVILGCAGMTDLVSWLESETQVPIIDGVRAGVCMVEALVRAGLRTSKACTYAEPRVKPQ